MPSPKFPDDLNKGSFMSSQTKAYCVLGKTARRHLCSHSVGGEGDAISEQRHSLKCMYLYTFHLKGSEN